MGIRTGLTALLLLLGLTSAGLGQQAVATGRYIRNPQAAMAGTGDFMIAWSEYDQQFNQQALARVYGADGHPTSPVFPLGGNTFTSESAVKVAADAHGNFIAVWNSDDGDGLGIFFQRYNRRAKKLGSPVRANRSVAGYQFTPNVAMSADGSFVVAWKDCPQSTDCPEIRVARFSAAGRQQGGELVIPVQRRGAIGDVPTPGPTPHVASEPGGIVVGWTEEASCGRHHYQPNSRIVHFTDSGIPVGEPFLLGEGKCETMGWDLAALTMDETGKTAAFFNGARNSVQLFEPDGHAAGPRTVIGRRNACPGGAAFERGCEKISSAAMAADGRFAVVWDFAQSTTDPAKPNDFFLAQFFDPEGRPQGERFEIASSSSLALEESAAAFSPDGTLIVVWSQSERGREGEDRLLFRWLRRN